MTHLKFEEYALPEEAKKRKTKLFVVKSNQDDTLLGRIYWNGGWRQYIFDPEPDCIWSHDCLLDLSKFIKVLMDERKVKKDE